MLATVPHRVADQLRAVRPHLKKTPLPFSLEGSPLDLLWPVATDDDEPCRFVLRDPSPGGAPMKLVGAPTSLLGARMKLVGAPTSLVGVPMRGTDRVLP